MTTATLHRVDDFAGAVRAALADLPADEVDDLTDGLEADLAERAADEESPDFGNPAVYASELRSAAGLPPRAPRGSRPIDNVLGDTRAAFVGGLRQLHTHPVIARLAAFLVALRPLWWAFRAAVFYGILTWIFTMPFLSFNFGTLLVGIVSLVVSVQLGRGKWQPRAWMRTSLLVVNVLLVITVPVALIAMSTAFGSEVNNAYADGQAQSTTNDSGLTYNGREITNIFAYDASGNALTNVQLFDQSGNPLDTVAHPNSTTVTDYPTYLVPNRTVIGRAGWNVYPLLRVSGRDLDENGLPKASAVPLIVKPTHSTVPPLGSTAPTASPSTTATPTASPTPTATPTPAPTN